MGQRRGSCRDATLHVGVCPFGVGAEGALSTIDSQRPIEMGELADVFYRVVARSIELMEEWTGYPSEPNW